MNEARYIKEAGQIILNTNARTRETRARAQRKLLARTHLIFYNKMSNKLLVKYLNITKC